LGFPEVIYCPGKESNQIVEIAKSLLKKESNVLATRITEETAAQLIELDPRFQYNKTGRICWLEIKPLPKYELPIVLVSAGTADLPVVEEAFYTGNIMGNHVIKITDVGVAGIHRLFGSIETIKKAGVLIVVAGMEGALASVVGGLVDIPVIAVPTSVGYGAHFNGLAPLLSMLNSCVPSVMVVNIDNGFGAAYAATVINRKISKRLQD
jgi:pyridinium-3,5-biscarboxylic acid mononucleotide synthase